MKRSIIFSLLLIMIASLSSGYAKDLTGMGESSVRECPFEGITGQTGLRIGGTYKIVLNLTGFSDLEGATIRFNPIFKNRGFNSCIVSNEKCIITFHTDYFGRFHSWFLFTYSKVDVLGVDRQISRGQLIIFPYFHKFRTPKMREEEANPVRNCPDPHYGAKGVYRLDVRKVNGGIKIENLLYKEDFYNLLSATNPELKKRIELAKFIIFNRGFISISITLLILLISYLRFRRRINAKIKSVFTS